MRVLSPGLPEGAVRPFGNEYVPVSDVQRLGLVDPVLALGSPMTGPCRVSIISLRFSGLRCRNSLTESTPMLSSSSRVFRSDALDPRQIILDMRHRTAPQIAAYALDIRIVARKPSSPSALFSGSATRALAGHGPAACIAPRAEVGQHIRGQRLRHRLRYVPRWQRSHRPGWMTWGERVGEHLVDMGSPLENDGDADVQVSGYSRRLGAVRPFHVCSPILSQTCSSAGPGRGINAQHERRDLTARADLGRCSGRWADALAQVGSAFPPASLTTSARTLTTRLAGLGRGDQIRSVPISLVPCPP